jgi:hypothetical protein
MHPPPLFSFSGTKSIDRQCAMTPSCVQSPKVAIKQGEDEEEEEEEEEEV